MLLLSIEVQICLFICLNDMFNRRMPNSNSAIQTEIDLFQPEILPNLSVNWHFSALFLTPKSPKTLSIPQLTICTSSETIEIYKQILNKLQMIS